MFNIEHGKAVRELKNAGQRVELVSGALLSTRPLQVGKKLAGFLHHVIINFVMS